MDTLQATRELLVLYPRVLHAIQTRHVQDGPRLVSRNQAGILHYLDELQPVTVNVLARQLGVTPGTMSMAIDRLERQGYVVRLRDVQDRRRVLVRLSSAGVRVREATAILDSSLVSDALKRLDAYDRRAVIHGLTLLARAVQPSFTAEPSRADPPSADNR